mmetsp:Transcript_14693/g.42303  ORF Transcript_14693/g.42303 Transcript_14693/m.42303 type:complete len:82 (-) Transcript_14693:7-252(-)
MYTFTWLVSLAGNAAAAIANVNTRVTSKTGRIRYKYIWNADRELKTDAPPRVTFIIWLPDGGAGLEDTLEGAGRMRFDDSI